jgi:ABC-type nickel/cobalt efflux system permease component RcnA
MGRGLLLANLSALMQGVTAVVAVGATLWLFARTARDANATANQLELLSYGLVIAVGIYLCLRALRGLMRPKPAHCCHDHAPNPETAGFLATMISTGMRPCSGGILVLVLAAALDLWWYGAAGVLAMSVGTGLTVSVLAVIAVKARSTAGRIVSGMDQGERRLRTVTHLAALAGGVLIIAFGISLIDSALTIGDHPLMRG